MSSAALAFEEMDRRIRALERTKEVLEDRLADLSGTVKALADRVECLERDSLQRMRRRMDSLDVGGDSAPPERCVTVTGFRRAGGVIVYDFPLFDTIRAAIPEGHRFRVTIEDCGLAEEPTS